MSIRGRRPMEEFSVSFLDVICCGFGAIILLLLITKTVAPVLLEKSAVSLEGQVASREQALHDIQGQIPGAAPAGGASRRPVGQKPAGAGRHAQGVEPHSWPIFRHH